MRRDRPDRPPQGGGKPIPADTRRRMGRAFGADFGGVRLHDGPEADRYAASRGMRAYAVGQDVGFAAGAWRPGDLKSEAILAHELAHTLQQRHVDPSGPLAPGRGGLEHDADRAAVGAALHLAGHGPVPRVTSAGGLQVQGCGEDPGVVTELEGMKADVEAAADATGPNGITARLMASILRFEMANVTFSGCSDQSEAREDELEEMEETISEVEAGGSPDRDDRNDSIGYAQIRMDTAAMVLGKTEWIDKSRRRRGDSNVIYRNFTRLPASEQRAIFEKLKDKHGNLETMAKLLEILKNRPHRYPSMTRADFGKNQKAVEIVGTEYNIGGTQTSAAKAKPSSYGRDVWSRMKSDPVVKKFDND